MQTFQNNIWVQKEGWGGAVYNFGKNSLYLCVPRLCFFVCFFLIYADVASQAQNNPKPVIHWHTNQRASPGWLYAIKFVAILLSISAKNSSTISLSNIR